jgi:hypothetical protein
MERWRHPYDGAQELVLGEGIDAGADGQSRQPDGAESTVRSADYGDYRLLSIKAASCDLERAPTLVASTLPFLKIISVGMPRIPNLAGVA